MIAFAAAVILLGTPAPDPKPWTIFGVGQQACGRWSLNHQDRNDGYTAMLAWLGGFLSALNHESVIAAKVNLTNDQDMAGAVGWIDNYCVAHPLDEVATAAERLASELRRRAAR